MILTQYYLPEMGAPQIRLSELAVGLKNLGWEVSIVTSLPNYPKGKIFNEYKRKFSVKENINEIPVRRYWLYPSNSIRVIPRIISMLSFSIIALFSVFFVTKLRPDFIFVESPPLTLGFSAWILSKLSGCRMILNVSDLYPLSAKELGVIKDGLLYRQVERLERFLYRNAFACTGQAQEIVEHIAANGGKKVLLFRNGVDSKRFSGNLPNSSSEKKKLVYAGLLGVAQGISEICQNVKFKDLGVEFHIYGTGAEREKIENFVSMNQEANIYLHPVIKKGEIPQILQNYNGALITLKKNIYGAVPSKIYEAMASGLPILFAGSGEGAEIIREHKLGWVSPPGDYKLLEKNIQDFVSNEEKRQTFSKNGKSVAKKKFDRSIQINLLNEFLKRTS